MSKHSLHAMASELCIARDAFSKYVGTEKGYGLRKACFYAFYLRKDGHKEAMQSLLNFHIFKAHKEYLNALCARMNDVQEAFVGGFLDFGSDYWKCYHYCKKIYIISKGYPLLWQLVFGLRLLCEPQFSDTCLRMYQKFCLRCSRFLRQQKVA